MRIAFSCAGEGFGHAARIVALGPLLESNHQFYYFIPKTVRYYIRSRLRYIPHFSFVKRGDRIHVLETIIQSIPQCILFPFHLILIARELNVFYQGINKYMVCPICKRESDDESFFEFHHFEPIASRRKTNDGIKCCSQCADQVHLLFNNTELRNQLNSLNLLLANEKLQKYINWVKTKPLTSLYTTATKKRKK